MPMHHVASNCNLKYRYVKGYNSEKSVFQNKGNKNGTAFSSYCVNCENFGHTTSYKVSETETNATENRREESAYE